CSFRSFVTCVYAGQHSAGGCACSAPGRGSSPSRRATCGNVVSSRRMHPPRRRPRRGCLPRYGNGLAAGAIARPKTGGHDPPFRGQCRSVTRALPHATVMAKPLVDEPPEPKHSSWRVWTPLTLTSTVFGLGPLTLKVRSMRPSPFSIMPASKLGGNLAPSPMVAWNRRALCFSLYAGKAVGSPTLQENRMLLG